MGTVPRLDGYQLTGIYKLMRSHILCCCMLSLISSLSKATAIDTKVNLVAPTTPNQLEDSFPDLPTDAFRVSGDYRGAELPAIACIMVCISARRELALLDFREDCPLPSSGLPLRGESKGHDHAALDHVHDHPYGQGDDDPQLVPNFAVRS